MKFQHTITYDELIKLFKYNANTGELMRILKNVKNKPTYISGTLTNYGYINIKINHITYMAHRLVWLYHYGKFPDKFIDHINGIHNDNRVENLRECTKQENSRNRLENANNKSGFKGVSWHKASNKWQSQCEVNGKNVYLGVYKTPEEAHEVYKIYSKEVFGEFYMEKST